MNDHHVRLECNDVHGTLIEEYPSVTLAEAMAAATAFLKRAIKEERGGSVAIMPVVARNAAQVPVVELHV